MRNHICHIDKLHPCEQPPHESSAIKRKELKSHAEAIHRVGAYQCDKCDFAAKKREVLKSHVEAIHRDVHGGVAFNEKSVISYQLREELKGHVKTIHMDELIDVMQIISYPNIF